jgi:hypothetical protein
LTVFNDLKSDVDQHQTLFNKSEAARDILQVTIQQTSVQINNQAQENSNYQDKLAGEIAELKATI